MKYVPILRIQQGEYLSLGALEDDVADGILPLMFHTPSFDDEPMMTAERRLKLFSRQWDRPAFFEPSLAVAYDGMDSGELYNAAADLGPYAPAILLDPAVARTASDAADKTGRAAIRINDPYVVLDPDLSDNLERCLDELDMGPDEVVLIFDLADSTDRRATAAVLRLPYFSEWNAVVLAGGAFQATTQPDTRSVIPRTHLANWRHVSQRAPREITFGDYGVLEARYQEPASFPPAAKLIYTEPHEWFYARGRSIRTDGTEQAYDLAAEIVERQHWRGRDYSWGDEWLDERAHRNGSAGHAPMWIRVALTHHMTHVVREDV